MRSLLDLHLGSRAARSVTVISAGESVDYVPDEWADALVIVGRGCIDLVTRSGKRYRFEAGAVLHLAGLYLRSLDNAGPDDAVVVALRRR